MSPDEGLPTGLVWLLFPVMAEDRKYLCLFLGKEERKAVIFRGRQGFEESIILTGKEAWAF